MTKAEQPTITQSVEVTQADIDAVKRFHAESARWMLNAIKNGDPIGEDRDLNHPIYQAFARHRTTSLAAQDEGLISDKSRIERLRRLVHRWITQGQVRGVVHDMDLQCEIDDAFAWANENGMSADTPSLAVQDIVDCETCCGSGEVVTDWDRYKHPHDGDVGDEAVAECPDCDGNGKIEVPSLAAQDGLVEALEEIGRLAETLCEYDGEVCNIAEYILSAHRSALSAIKGDKS